jgi:hypothetical protein
MNRIISFFQGLPWKDEEEKRHTKAIWIGVGFIIIGAIFEIHPLFTILAIIAILGWSVWPKK